jgi:hypothetical protein
MGIIRRASSRPTPPSGGSVGPLPGQGEPPAWAALSGVDEKGQALPVPDVEWAARQQSLSKELADIDAEDETPDDVYGAFLRHVDEERHRVGRPPAFGGAS